MHAPARTFALTWLSYASYYLTRKNLSVVKKTLEREEGVSRAELGHLDTGYLAAYAVGQLAFGVLADRIGPRRVLGVGMLASAACAIGFGLSSALVAFALFFALNGIAQATGWSSNVKAMAGAYPREGRGRVMGAWATCYVVGGLAAGPVAAAFAAAHGWRAAFFGPACLVALVGGVILVALPDRARDRAEAPSAAERAALRAARREVLRSGMVWAIGASYFFVKLTRYVLLFWLIYFMEDQLGYSNARATLVALAFEVGGVGGAVALGAVSDRFFRARRVTVSVLSLVVLALALAAYGETSALGISANVVSLAVIGFFLFGPDALLSGAAAQDAGGPAAAGAAAGAINGLGSLGPILGSELVAPLSLRLGWGGFYLLLAAGALCSAAILLPCRRREEARALPGPAAA